MRYGEIMRRGLATVVAFLTMLLAVPALPGDFELKLIGTFTTGVFDESAAETVAHDPSTQRLFVTNADARGIDVLDITDPTEPTLLFTIDLSSVGDEPTARPCEVGLACPVWAVQEHVERRQHVSCDVYLRMGH